MNTITVTSKLNLFAEVEIIRFAKILLKDRSDRELAEIAHDIVKTIDWSNSALMHKGLSWITYNYLEKKNML